jgi:hypothetical protein
MKLNLIRNKRNGVLSYEWKDFNIDGFLGEVHISQNYFESKYGEFEAMLYPREDSIKPYAIWSKENVVLLLENDVLGLASIPRKPSTISFG